MTTPQVPSPVARRILRGGDRWRYAMRGIALQERRPPQAAIPAGSSIRSVWLRLSVDRPKLAAPTRGA
jgi:hypothetical protein